MSSCPFPELNDNIDSESLRAEMARKPKSRTDYLFEVGTRLRLLRAAKKRTQKSVAIAIGISEQKWNNYERGRDLIPVPTAIRLCILTGATLDYIYQGYSGTLPSALVLELEEAAKVDAGGPLARRA